MALQIRRPPTAFSKTPTGKISKRVEDKNYLDFIRSLPCIITGEFGVDAAHISFARPLYGKLGRGKSSKESDRWTLPMSHDEHMKSHHMGEEKYWEEIGIDPCILALSLYGAYPNEDLARFIIREWHLKIRG